MSTGIHTTKWFLQCFTDRVRLPREAEPIPRQARPLLRAFLGAPSSSSRNPQDGSTQIRSYRTLCDAAWVGQGL